MKCNKIYCVDSIFSHANHISTPDNNVRASKHMMWDFNVPSKTSDIVVYTETSFDKIKDSIPNRIAWVIESPEITCKEHKWIEDNHTKFKYVLTHNKKLLDVGANIIFAPLGGCWLWNNEIQIYDKIKNISIISSWKNQTDGHKLRHSIISKYSLYMDIYGNGYNPIQRKIEGLRDYRFSICVENTKQDYYFSEKIMDCFLSGTIPIYWGCPSIEKFFNINGILCFNNIEQLSDIVNNCDEKLYEKLLPYIKINFEKAHEYILTEDWVIQNTNILNYEN
jgi:hypothetical protein